MDDAPRDRADARSSPESEPDTTTKQTGLEELQQALRRATEAYDADLRKLGDEAGATASPAAPASAASPLLNPEPASAEMEAGEPPGNEPPPAPEPVTPGYSAREFHAEKSGRGEARKRLVLLLCMVPLGIGGVLWLSMRTTIRASGTAAIGAANTPTLPLIGTPLPSATPTSGNIALAVTSTPSAIATVAPYVSAAPNQPSTAAPRPSATSKTSTIAGPTTPSPGTLATPARTMVPSRAGVLIFSAYQTSPGDAQIVMMEPDGTNRRPLTALPGHPWAPRLSPDGKRILFSSALPAKVGRAVDTDLNGSGSPDIMVANIDGTQVRRLTTGGAGYNGWSWSPDGRRIAFASNRDGSWSIYVMTAAGEGLTRLTNSLAQDGWPVWTSDGAGLIFTSTRSDQSQLYRIDVDGSNVRRLLATQTTDTEPTVGPGTGRIAFSAQTTDGGAEIYVADRDGTNPRRLTSRGGLNSEPVWSPDGTKVAFVSRQDGHSDIYIVNVDGSGLLRLTTTGENRRPDWGTP